MRSINYALLKFLSRFSSSAKIKLRKNIALNTPLTINYPAEAELKIIKSIIPPEKPFFDVGANYGIYSYIAKDIVDLKNIYCFEPITKPYTALQKNLRGANLFNLALSNEVSIKTIKVPYINGDCYDTRATLETGIENENETHSNKIEIQTSTLDTIVEKSNISSIGFIKIDVEGHEFNVIKGGLTSIRKFKPILQLEIEQRQNSQPIENIFKLVLDLGYSGHYINVSDLTLIPIITFSKESNQKMSDFKTHKFINNFLFFPTQTEQTIINKISKQLNIEKSLVKVKNHALRTWL